MSRPVDRLTIERLFAEPALSGPAPRGLKLAPDGTRVTYLRGKDGDQFQLDLWQVEIATGQASLLVDSDWLDARAEVLSPEEQARRERARTASLSGIVDYQVAPGGGQLLFPLNGALHLFDLATGGRDGMRRITHGGGHATDPKLSPRGRYVAFVREQDLWLVDLASGEERRLTHDGGGTISNGVAEFVADEEMDRHTGYWWAPDDSAIAFARIDEAPVPVHRRFETLADRTEVVEQRYPMAGEANVRVQLGVVHLHGEGGPRTQWLDLGADPDIYLARVQWLPDARRLSFQRQSRDQQRLDLVVAELASGEQRTLLVERSDTWIELHDDLRFLRHHAAFLWSSEREGSRQLYLVGPDGDVLRRVTTTPWPIDRVLAVDERHDRVLVAASGPDPLEQHVYAYSLAQAGEPVRLTREPGWHDAVVSRDARRMITTHSDPSTPPRVRVLDGDGAPLAPLEANALDAGHPYAPFLGGHQAPHFGTLQSVDGQDLHYAVLTPPGFDPARRYPVILRYYGGPGRQFVSRSWTSAINTGCTDLLGQLWAQAGYVVFALDNRGTPRRETRFTRAIRGRMGGPEIEDQLVGVDWLVRQPWVDAARIGAFGWSYGGYQTLMLMAQAPGRIAAGVAVAPVTDYALYDTHYTERFLGHPDANPAGYRDSNVLNHLDGLQAPLLLVHGMADDNVLLTHTTLLMSELQLRGKAFELMLYPGAKHGILGQANRTHLYRAIDAFFARHLRPGE